MDAILDSVVIEFSDVCLAGPRYRREQLHESCRLSLFLPPPAYRADRLCCLGFKLESADRTCKFIHNYSSMILSSGGEHKISKISKPPSVNRTFFEAITVRDSASFCVFLPLFENI